jgi:hypothetical protein
VDDDGAVEDTLGFVLEKAGDLSEGCERVLVGDVGDDGTPEFERERRGDHGRVQLGSYTAARWGRRGYIYRLESKGNPFEASRARKLLLRGSGIKLPRLYTYLGILGLGSQPRTREKSIWSVSGIFP